MSNVPSIATDRIAPGKIAKQLATFASPLLGLLLVIAFFTVADRIYSARKEKPARFATFNTMEKILRESSQVGVAALGMTIIIIAGGIDLSVGAAMALCATVTAWYFREGYSPGVAVGAGLMCGCATGMLNGLLISGLRVVPFIITLGSMAIFSGLGDILSNNTPVRAFGLVPEVILNLQRPTPLFPGMVISSGVALMLLLAVCVAVLLHLTVFGRHLYAIGSSEPTARLCGVPVTRVRILTYTLAGFFTAVAGLFQFAFLNGEGDPKAGVGKELDAIAACVIGGASLKGGRGSVLGTLAGVWIMAVVFEGCVMLGLSSAHKKVILGVIIVIAVAIDQQRQRRADR